MKRLTILCIALTPILLGLYYWVDHQARALTFSLAILPVCWAILFMKRGKLRGGLIQALIGAGAAAILVAFALVHQTESGRAFMWRVASAIFT